MGTTKQEQSAERDGAVGLQGVVTRRGWRKLTVADRLWWWKCGRANVVARADDTDEKRVTTIADLLGWHPNEVERARWKRQREIVTPRHVASWLEAV